MEQEGAYIPETDAPPDPEVPTPGVNERNEPERDPNLLERFREVQRTVAGRVARLTLAVGAAAGIASGGDYLRGEGSRDEAWHRFQDAHPEIEQLRYRTLEDVPDRALEPTLRQRDRQYALRLQEAGEALRSRGADPEGIARLEQELHRFGPSTYDRELRRMDLGSLVTLDTPFPVIRFEDREERTTGSFSVSHEVAVDDTIFIKPTAEHAHEVMEHEYLHTLQVVGGPKEEAARNRMDAVEEVRKSFDEGSTELLRVELNERLGRTVETQSYLGEQYAVFELKERLGDARFWELVKSGQHGRILTEYNGNREGLAEMLLNERNGAAAVLNESTISVDQTESLQTLDRERLMPPERIAAFNERYGYKLRDPREQAVRLPDGRYGALYKIQRDAFVAAVTAGRFRFYLDSAKDPSEGAVPLDRVPTVERSWERYRTCAPQDRAAVAAELRAELGRFVEFLERNPAGPATTGPDGSAER